jgi:5-methyltetrahydrofolate--homocysteine methyltransferase
MNPATRADFLNEIEAEYNAIRADYNAKSVALLPLAEARQRRYLTDYLAPAPKETGRKVIDIDVADVERFINWTFFFNAWKLHGQQATAKCDCGHCHTHADETDVTRQAEAVKADALRLMQRLKNDQSAHIRAVVEICSANSDGDDIVVDGGALRLPMLRQQRSQAGVCLSLADYVAPVNCGEDHIGLFAVTAGVNLDDIYREFNANADIYSKLLLQLLCDRLAEAAAEWLHCHVRRHIWGYAPAEQLAVKDMWQNRHQGIRPAIGYPSIPDQTVMHLIDSRLQLSDIGVSLTENGAMTPTASVSGLYIANPAATYFAVGQVAEDQLSDYAARRATSSAAMRAILRM